MMNKKVVVIYSGARYWGGIETYLVNLFSAKTDLQLILISFGEWPLTKKLQEKNYKVVLLSGKRISFGTIINLYKYIKENEINLLASGGLVGSTYTRLLSFITQTPCVITVHSLLELDYPNKLISFIYFLINKFSRWRTTKYIAVSKFLKNNLVKSGVKSKKIEVVYNGIEDIGIQEHRRDKKEVVIGSIGRLHYVKGFHNLVKAIAILKDEPIKLLIWGEGDEKNELDEMIKKYHLTDRLYLMGHAENLESAFKEIDIYVQPSLMEGFGMTVVEAMLAEKPIVVSPSGSLPELIKDGESGVVAKSTEPEALAAALRIFIENKSFANTLAKNAREQALKFFGLEKFQKETLRIFSESIIIYRKKR